MKNKKLLKETYKIDKRLDDIFRGDHIEIESEGRFLLASNLEALNFINIQNGKKICQLFLNDKQKQIQPDKLLIANDGRDEYILTFVYNSLNQTLIIASNNGLLRHFLLTIESKLNDGDDGENIEINYQLQRTWKSMHIGPIVRIKFDITGELIATGGSDGSVKLWNLKQKYCTHNFKNQMQGVIETITFAPSFTKDSYQILASGDDYCINIWNLIDSKHQHKLDGHESKITEILFTPDRQSFISGSRDKLIIIWNWSTMAKQRTMAVYESIEAMILVPIRKFSRIIQKTNENDKHNVLVVAGNDGRMKIWDYRKGCLLYEQQESLLAIQSNDPQESSESKQQYTQINQLIYNSKLEQIIAISYDKDIVFHQIETMKPIKQMIGQMDEVLDLKFIGDENNYVAAATNSPKIRVFDLKTSSCSFLTGHTDIVLTLAVFPVDRYLMISSSKDNTIRVWRFNSNDCHQACCLYQGTGHTHSVTSLATSSLEGNLFFVSGSEDTTFKFWKIPKNNLEYDPEIKMKDLRAKSTQCCHDKTINSIDISPNDQFIATGSQDRTAKLWSIPNCQLISVFRGHRKSIWTVCFSPVDQILATGSADSTIKLWSIGSQQQQCLRTFQGHESSVLKLKFIDEGIQLLSSSSDGNIKIWSLQSNECRQTFSAHEGKIWAMDISNDEQCLVTGSDDSTIAIWHNVTEEMKAIEQIKREEMIENEQKLQNLLHQKQWLKALKLAIQFEQPLRCLQILKELQMQTNDLESFVDLLVKNLNEDHLLLLLDYSVHWNTNSKHWIQAQCTINACLKKFPPKKLENIKDFQSKVVKLLPYCQRHQCRMQRLRQMTTFVDFVFEQMKISDS